MRLRTKFFLITATATIVPVVAATLLGRAWVERNSRAELSRSLREGEKEVRRRYKTLQGEVLAAVSRLANAEDHFVGPLLISLAAGGPDDRMFQKLPRTAPRVMQERGLDVLTVLGPKRRILASGHFPGRTGDTEARWPRALKRRRRLRAGARMAAVRVMRGGRPRTQLAVVAWRAARSSLGSQVFVGGGRFLDKSFVRRLRLSEETSVLIRDRKGKVIVSPKGGWGHRAGFPKRTVRLSGAGGRTVATITLAVSDERLQLTLAVINVIAAGAVLGGLLLALLLGALARPITRPLEQLVVAAEAVAAGDLEHRIPARRRGDEVGELIDSFNRMTAEIHDSKERLVAAERVAAWREIARRIAHEIKNPLFPIQTSIETLRKVHEKRHPDFEEIFAESTTTILEEVARMKHIVTEFSNFARMPKPTAAPFDVGDWISSTVGLYAAEGISVELECADEVSLVGDREQLTQVLANLVKNACDACRGVAEPRLQVRAAAAAEDLLEVSVEDNGCGFDEETAARIFTPYFTTKKDVGGTGLGLAICQRIVMDHGGSMEADGGEGRGACFTIRLPLMGPREPADPASAVS